MNKTVDYEQLLSKQQNKCLVKNRTEICCFS